MAQPLVKSAYPHGVTAQGREPAPVRILTANGVAINRNRVPVAPNRGSQWIVQIVIVATSVFAVLDLYLLATSFHH
jgi:hypothetical protein